MDIPTHSSHKQAAADIATEHTSTNDAPSSSEAPQKALTMHSTWRKAFQHVLPVYIATHVAFLLLTYLATLFNFVPKNFSVYTLPLSTLVQSWERWDSYHFVEIATKGYDVAYRTAFFPLFPLLEAGLGVLLHDPFVAGLLISNLAGLGMLVVLYRLVAEDFDDELADRTVLYLSVFPTAFFFAAAYNESLFLFLALLSFYYMRRGQWWLAALFGFFASLTRSAGLFLLAPFLYEYLRQHHFHLKQIGIDVLSGLGIPAGLGAFALYCYIRFHDALAFSHAQQSGWLRDMHGPWHGMLDALLIILHRNILTFDSIHNVIDLGAGLLMLILVVLGFVGPWRFPRQMWAYAFYAAISYLFILLFPVAGGFPLSALSRYVLEVFPAFLVLASMGKGRQFHLYYLTLAGTLLVFLLLQFLTGYWII
jgi:Gpi18-like mannosyltransferase